MWSNTKQFYDLFLIDNEACGALVKQLPMHTSALRSVAHYDYIAVWFIAILRRRQNNILPTAPKIG